MATYDELYELFRGGTAAINELHKRISVATIIAADNVFNESDATPNHANRLIWAKKVMEKPETYGLQLLPAVLAENKAASQAGILAATDSAIQTAVEAVVNLFADGSV